ITQELRLMSDSFRWGSIALAVVVLGAVSARAGVMPIDSSLQLMTSSLVDVFNNATLVVDNPSQSQTTALDPLAVSASATATLGGQSIVTSGSMAASWISASEGTFTATGVGWATQSVINGRAETWATDQPNFVYDFQLDQDAVIRVDYSVAVVPGT